MFNRLKALLAVSCLTFTLLGCDAAPSEGEGQLSFQRAQQGKPIPPGFDFSLLDQTGAYHQLSRYQSRKAILLINHGLTCSNNPLDITAADKVAQTYPSEDVSILMINASADDSREKIRAHAAENRTKLPVLMDETQFISWSFEFKQIGEVLIIDPKRWEIVYRGPLDTSEDSPIIEILDLLVSGESPVSKITRSIESCTIAYDNSYHKPPSTYTQEIAYVLEKRCATCHTEGGIAPWAMSDYTTVKNWSFMMREVIKTRRMPPWHADDQDQLLVPAASMKVDEKRRLLQWLSNGTPRGEGEDPLLGAQLAKSADESPWVLGEPDKIVDAGKFDIPATGLLPYKYVVIPLNNKEDIYVSAVHLRPTNSTLLHHGFAFVISPIGFHTPEEKRMRGSWESGVFATYVPGVFGEVNPENVVRLIPANSKILFELHFTPSGKADTSNVELGLYITEPKKADRIFKMDAVYNRWFRVPAGAENWPVTATKTFEKDATLYEMMPHMHYRGSSMKYTLNYPDGRSRLLLSVPKFDFNWQRQYKLKQPIEIPAGSELVVEGSFDNSLLNRYNPDPAQSLAFGPLTTDEMFIGYITYTIEGQ